MRSEDFPSNRAGQVIKARTGYWAFIPNPLPPAALAYDTVLIRLLGEAERAIGELAGVGRLLPDPHLLIAPAVRREAVLSSKIEGTHSGLGDLFFFEAAPEEVQDPADVREVSNYVTALEYGLVRLDEFPLSLRLIREIHERLMRGVRGDAARPGEFRSTQNWIGPPGATLMEATFVPPPVPDMEAALDAFEKYLHAENDPTPPLIRLACIHSQFEMIHPFADGNGRVGRLLIVLLLVHWGLLPAPLLYLSAFFESHRDDYYRHLLAVSREGAWEAWIAYFLRGVREQARDAALTAKRLLDLQQEYRRRLSAKRLSKITLSLLDALFLNPVTTAPRVRDRFQVNFRTAQGAIDDLVEIGVLREVTGQRRNRAWMADGILAAIAGQPETQREAT
jgi:Fic family protein